MWFYLQTAEGKEILDLQVHNTGRETLCQCWALAVYQHMILRYPTFHRSWGIAGREPELAFHYKPKKDEVVLVRFSSLLERNDEAGQT
jgi:hypothetical protein